ncbi:MAG TPA: HU family DNA-binding protein [bacterium]|nr:HU family DNA-binding protein [bacterium]HEX68410.1 HU family DNA-binding protein [bacterium]
MNKAELIEKVAEVVSTKKEAAAAVDAVFNAITEALGKGEDVRLVGFGTFSVRTRAARKGRNPRTGATINIPAKKVPVFRAGKGLKEAVA